MDAHWTLFKERVSSRRKLILRVCLALFVPLFLVYVPFTADDSYISFRYAKNLVESGNWNWNPNGEHEEAYTSLVHAVFAVVPVLIGIDPAIFFKILGLFFLFAMLWDVRKIGGDFPFLVALLTVAANPQVYIHVFSGMETILFMFVLLKILVCLEFNDDNNINKLFFYLFIFPMIRPEGIVISFIVLFQLISRKNASKILYVAILWTLYYLIRCYYFNDLFPNPYYVKVGKVRSIETLLVYSIKNFSYYVIFTLLMFANVAKKSINTFIGSYIILIFVYFSSALQMSYADRFMFQIVIPYLLFSLTILKDKFTHKTVYVLVSLVLYGGVVLRGLPEYAEFVNDPAILAVTHREFGRDLSRFRDDGLTVLLGDAGMIPYFSGVKCHDYIGLATRRFAKDGTTREILRQMDPQLVILFYFTANMHRFRDPILYPVAVHEYMQSRGDYEMIGSYQVIGQKFVLFSKKDFKRIGELKEIVRETARKRDALRLNLTDFLFLRYI